MWALAVKFLSETSMSTERGEGSGSSSLLANESERRREVASSGVKLPWNSSNCPLLCDPSEGLETEI